MDSTKDPRFICTNNMLNEDAEVMSEITKKLTERRLSELDETLADIVGPLLNNECMCFFAECMDAFRAIVVADIDSAQCKVELLKNIKNMLDSHGITITVLCTNNKIYIHQHGEQIAGPL